MMVEMKHISLNKIIFLTFLFLANLSFGMDWENNTSSSGLSKRRVVSLFIEASDQGDDALSRLIDGVALPAPESGNDGEEMECDEVMVAIGKNPAETEQKILKFRQWQKQKRDQDVHLRWLYWLQTERRIDARKKAIFGTRRENTVELSPQSVKEKGDLRKSRVVRNPRALSFATAGPIDKQAKLSETEIENNKAGKTSSHETFPDSPLPSLSPDPCSPPHSPGNFSF